MAEIIVKYKEDTDRMKVKGGEYVQDLIRCKECRRRYSSDRSRFCIGRHDDFFCADGVKHS